MSRKQRLPVRYPSIPDAESGPTRYNEPTGPIKEDRAPDTHFELSEQRSRADLRLRIEQLLRRRESIRADDWAKLGGDARSLLIEMLDDVAVRSQSATLHRLIAVLGQLSVKRSVAPLGAILLDEAETSLTRVYAANALGRIGEASAVDALISSSATRDGAHLLVGDARCHATTCARPGSGGEGGLRLLPPRLERASEAALERQALRRATALARRASPVGDGWRWNAGNASVEAWCPAASRPRTEEQLP